jgi:hypothetical protein
VLHPGNDFKDANLDAGFRLRYSTADAHFSADLLARWMAAATEVCAFRKMIIAALKIVNEYAFVEMLRD